MSKYLPFNLFLRQALLYPLTSPFLPPENKVEKDYSYAAGKLIGTLVAANGYGLPKTGQTVLYRTGDDGDLEIGMPDTPPRFTDNNDGTITDNATGLMWVKEPGAIGGDWGSAGSPSKMTWNNAIDNCLALDYAGYDDWRLPNVLELISIQNFSRDAPSIYVTFFPYTKNDWYYSSTTRKGAATKAWTILFFYFTITDKLKTDIAYPRPVRGQA